MNFKDLINMKLAGSAPEISADSIGLAALIKNSIIDGSTIFDYAKAGSIDGTKDEIVDFFSNLGGSVLYESMTHAHKIYLFDSGIISISFTNNTYLDFSVLSNSKEFVKKIKDKIAPLFVMPKVVGCVYAITSSMGQLSLTNIGNAGMELIRQNYDDQVLKDYDFVIKELRAKSPSGRIVVLEGAPGTGKTHMVKALTLEVPDAMFVIISPNMVSSLGGPELLPLLLRYKRSSGPIILVIEDADKCLITRAGGEADTGIIQSILNLGDGILGSLLDIRIIATTNAKKFEMDSAILRPGRLSKRLEVGLLNTASAQKIFSSLLPGVDFPAELNGTDKISLATVYSLARQSNWLPEDRKDELVEDELEDDDSDDYNESDDD